MLSPQVLSDETEAAVQSAAAPPFPQPDRPRYSYSGSGRVRFTLCLFQLVFFSELALYDDTYNRIMKHGLEVVESPQ